MFGSTILEVTIGLVLLFSILSLIVSSGRELLEALLQTRAIHLERGIRELLEDEDGTGLAQQLYRHPFISNLFRGSYNPEKQLTGLLWKHKDPWKRIEFRSNLPAYIPARNFAAALLDLATRGEPNGYDALAEPVTFDRVVRGVARMPNESVRRALLIALQDARGDIDTARANVEDWFDSSMDRVSGWYRKQTQWILLGLGLLTAVLLNVDTLRIARALYQDDALRTVVVNQAEAVSSKLANTNVSDADLSRLADALGCPQDDGAKGAPEAGSKQRAIANCSEQRLQTLGFPMGWTGYTIIWPWQQDWDSRSALKNYPWEAIPGWILTALALSLGAPFWFDLLNKLMVIRSTVKPDEKSPEEASKDPTVAKPPAEPAALPPAEDRQAPDDAQNENKGPPDAGAADQAQAQAAAFEPHEWKSGDPQEGDL